MAKRIQNSFGKCHFNDGSCLVMQEGKYVLDHTRKYYIFDIVPMGAVRMTKSDTWKTNPNHINPLKRQRPAVTKYWAWKNLLTLQANQMGFVLGEHLDAVYLVPMPESWSAKKKEANNGMPCKSKPDIDNYVKAFLDALKKEDGDVWNIKAIKVYAYKGSIILFA